MSTDEPEEEYLSPSNCTPCDDSGFKLISDDQLHRDFVKDHILRDVLIRVLDVFREEIKAQKEER